MTRSAIARTAGSCETQTTAAPRRASSRILGHHVGPARARRPRDDPATTPYAITSPTVTERRGVTHARVHLAAEDAGFARFLGAPMHSRRTANRPARGSVFVAGRGRREGRDGGVRTRLDHEELRHHPGIFVPKQVAVEHERMPRVGVIEAEHHLHLDPGREVEGGFPPLACGGSTALARIFALRADADRGLRPQDGESPRERGSAERRGATRRDEARPGAGADPRRALSPAAAPAPRGSRRHRR